LFRNVDRHQPQAACFSKQATRDLKILRLNGCDLRKYLLLGKLQRGALNLALLVGKVFGSKNGLRLSLLDQETSARSVFYMFWVRTIHACLRGADAVPRCPSVLKILENSSRAHSAAHAHRN